MDCVAALLFRPPAARRSLIPLLCSLAAIVRTFASCGPIPEPASSFAKQVASGGLLQLATLGANLQLVCSLFMLNGCELRLVTGSGGRASDARMPADFFSVGREKPQADATAIELFRTASFTFGAQATR